MTIEKCDKCGRTIKSEPIHVGIGFGGRAELCRACDKGIIEFLVANELLVDRLISYKFVKQPKLHSSELRL